MGSEAASSALPALPWLRSLSPPSSFCQTPTHPSQPCGMASPRWSWSSPSAPACCGHGFSLLWSSWLQHSPVQGGSTTAFPGARDHFEPGPGRAPGPRLKRASGRGRRSYGVVHLAGLGWGAPDNTQNQPGPTLSFNHQWPFFMHHWALLIAPEGA